MKSSLTHLLWSASAGTKISIFLYSLLSYKDYSSKLELPK